MPGGGRAKGGFAIHSEKSDLGRVTAVIEFACHSGIATVAQDWLAIDAEVSFLDDGAALIIGGGPFGVTLLIEHWFAVHA